MRHVILAGLRARRTRLLLTAAAIALGVAFVVATVAITDTLAAQFYASTARQAQDVAVRVSSTDARLTDADLTAVRGVAGVRAAAGRTESTGVLLGTDGRVVTTFGNADSAIRALADDQRLAGFDLATGRYPAGPGEVVVDRDAAAAQGWTPGATVRLVTTDGERVEFRLAGTADVTEPWPVVHLFPADLARVAAPPGWSAIDVLAAPGTPDAELRDAVAAAVDSGGRPVRVITGAEYTDALASAAVGDVAQIRLALGAFALVALLVSAMVIHNTFAILVAQRQRELALLRCVGAGRGQVFRSVLAEAAALGLLASLLGFGLGLGIGWLGTVALGATDFGLDVPLQVGGTAFVAALLVGVGVTVASAVVPARGATRIAPVAALASQPDLAPTGTAGVLRTVAGIGSLLLGTAMVVTGAIGGAIVLMVAGALPVTLGVLALGPVVVGPLARLIGRVPALLFGVAGRLAAAGADRSPRRAAATAISLTIGITLVTAFLVSAETLKYSLDDQMRKRFPIDYLVTAPDGHRLSGDLPGRLDSVAGIERAIPLAAAQAQLRAGGRTAPADVGGFHPVVLSREFALPVRSGSMDDFAAGGVVLDPDTATALGVTAGDRITVAGPDGSADVVVSAVLSMPASPLPQALLAPAEAAAVVGTPAPYGVLVWVDAGVPAATARTAVASVTDTEPLAVVADVQTAGDETGAIIDGLLAVVASLIVLSVAIAVAGIANTLTLSVLERTREFGLLRAIGLGRRQLRVMLLAEGAVLAAVAAVVGVAGGIGFGVAAAYAAIPRDWLVLALPYGRIGLVVLGAVLVGLLAGVAPARRAARVPPVAALAAD